MVAQIGASTFATYTSWALAIKMTIALVWKLEMSLALHSAPLCAWTKIEPDDSQASSVEGKFLKDF